MEMKEERYSLGIDLGTTSVKIAIVNESNREIIYSTTQQTKADVNLSDSGKSEQSVGEIFNVLNTLVQNIPQQVKEKVQYIGTSGQMHGVVMWREQPHVWHTGKFNIIDGQTTNLITWQDGRCSREFLDSLPDTGTLDRLNSGFGLPTLIWLQRYDKNKFQHFTHCGTIQDLLVAILTGTTSKPTITDQNASSWGFYNTDNKQWKTNLLEKIDFPTNILPTITDSDVKAGTLVQSWSHIPVTCVVGGAVGDLETSVLSILHDKESTNCAIINISTSIQLTFLLPSDFKLNHFQTNENTSRIEFRPYFGNRVLAVGAGLNGGNFLAYLVSTIKSWMSKFGLVMTEDQIWEILLSEGSKTLTTDLIIDPTLLGERHCPHKTASISNIKQGNMNLGDLMRSACAGVISNLEELLPKEMLSNCGVKKIYTTGSALIRNQILQQEIQRRYKEFEVQVCNAGDAAFGAAIMGQL